MTGRILAATSLGALGIASCGLVLQNDYAAPADAAVDGAIPEEAAHDGLADGPPEGDSATTAPDGARDASAEAAPPLCRYTFCETFDIDLSLWARFHQPSTSLSFGAIDRATHYRGSGSLRLEQPAVVTGNTAYFESWSHSASLPDPFWMRVFVYSPAGLNDGELVLVTTADSGSGLHVYLVGGGLSLGSYGVPGADGDTATTQRVGTGAWQCLELGFDRASGTYSVFVDGGLLASLHVPLAGALAEAKVALDYGTGTTAITEAAFFDELAYDRARVGCTP